MAPQADDRHQEQHVHQGAENPFVKFRQSVDHELGRLLQSIVGLPSATQRQPSKSDRFGTHEHQDAYTEATEIPSKEYQGWPIDSAYRGMDDGGGENGPELCSPVTKYLFRHLMRKPDDDVDWSHVPRSPDHPKYGHFASIWEPLQYSLRLNQQSHRGLEELQSVVLNELNRTARLGRPGMHSNTSMLPYLLFSKYSPLALTHMPPLRGPIREDWDRDVNMSYCDAFEDLLRTSIPEQGVGLDSHGAWPVYLPAKQFFSNGKPWKEAKWVSPLSQAGLKWISGLHQLNLLDPGREIPEIHESLKSTFNSEMRWLTSLRRGYLNSLWPNGDPDTDQASYDQFVEEANQMAELCSASPVKALTREFMRGLPWEAYEKFAKVFDARNYEPGPTTDEYETAAEEDHVAMMQRLDETERQWKAELEEQNMKQLAMARKEQENAASMVSSLTTTERTTLDDGTIQTTVVVERVFANGKRTTTETVHKHHPQQEQRWGEARAAFEEEADSKPAKKGWFW